jgi:hypothetical protein
MDSGERRRSTDPPPLPDARSHETIVRHQLLAEIRGLYRALVPDKQAGRHPGDQDAAWAAIADKCRAYVALPGQAMRTIAETVKKGERP